MAAGAPTGFRGVFRDDWRARAAYAEGAGIYRIVPSAVARPADAQDLQTLVRWAGRIRRTLVPRGAGSGMGGGNVGDGIVVDLTALGPDRITIDPAARLARTGAAATVAGLNAEALRHGLRLPPVPSSGRWATLGGMVATNASGARSVQCGSVRPWVEGLEVVTAEGEPAALARGRTDRGLPPGAGRIKERVGRARAEVEAAFPGTRKNSSGYAADALLASGDLLDLLIGSEGTLALVTGVTWGLEPVPPHAASLRIALGDLESLGEVADALVRLSPSAVEVMDRTFGDLIRGSVRGEDDPFRDGVEAVLLVEFERTTEASVRGAVGDAVRAVRDFPAEVVTALSAPEARRLWEIRHAASPILASLPDGRRSLQVIEDACVPVRRLGEYIASVRSAGRELDLELVIFGHAGDGNVHVNVLPEVGRPDWEPRVAALFDRVTERVVRLGGTTTGEHGDGRLRAGALERVFGPAVVGLFREIKQAFDPAGLLNPGVILPAPGDRPLTRLKVGAGAAALPSDVAAALREIERTAGYARSRLDLAGPP